MSFFCSCHKVTIQRVGNKIPKNGSFTVSQYQEELERYLGDNMKVMIITVCLNLQSLYNKIIITLCDNIEELNQKNKYCNNIYQKEMVNNTTDFELARVLLSVFRCYQWTSFECLENIQYTLMKQTFKD